LAAAPNPPAEKTQQVAEPVKQGDFTILTKKPPPVEEFAK
jgi:hypothetical protein